MAQEMKDEKILRRYLLGELSERELDEIERRLMTEADYFDFATALEEELVDKYVCENLTDDEREKFSRRFLSTPQGLEEVNLAAALKKYAFKNAEGEISEAIGSEIYPSEQRATVFQILRLMSLRAKYAFATLAIALVAIIGLLLFANRQLQSRVENLRAGQDVASSREQELQSQLDEQQARNNELTKSLESEREARSILEQELKTARGSAPDQLQPTFAAITLFVGRTRGEGGNIQLIMKPGVTQAFVNLIVSGPSYSSYRAELLNDSADQVWTSGVLTPRAQGNRTTIKVTIPADQLSGGDYMLKLQRLSQQGAYVDAGNYYFRSVKK